MKIYNVRKSKKSLKWHKISAGSPSIAAQLYAEKVNAKDGDVVTVMGEGRFSVERRVVIHKAI